MKSFPQDLIFGVRRGKIKPPKQTLLPYSVKILTNNVDLIQILNCSSHRITYSQLEEINTALCLQKMASASEIPLPDNIQPLVCTTLAWNNIDCLEETLSGEGTSQRVNGQQCRQGILVHDFPQSTLLQPTCQPSMKFWHALLRSRMCFNWRATKIVWKHPDIFKGIVLRMGAFNTICTLIYTGKALPRC